jgi:hypothetical protein
LEKPFGYPDRDHRVTHTITLVTDVFVSKREALGTLSGLIGASVNYSDPANATITLTDDVVLSIEVPKFGEDLPLTLDLTGRREGDVQQAADDLITRLGRELSWSVSVVPDS